MQCYLHNNDDNILTASAARPAAISIARRSDLEIVDHVGVGRFVQLAAYESRSGLSPHLDSVVWTRTPAIVTRYTFKFVLKMSGSNTYFCIIKNLLYYVKLLTTL